MSRSGADDKTEPIRAPRGKAGANIGDTVPDISMEDTDAAAQMIPDPGESFSGAPTLVPTSEVADYPSLAEVEADSYVFGPEIARGGMGRILSARDRRTGRSVAIKEVLPELIAGLSESDKDGLVARFQREARVTALLQHPSIVPVYEIGNFNGRPFFAMKKVDGLGLDTLISERKTLAERLELLPTIVSVAEALAYAHDQQVVHRDLKSSNILVGAFGETVVIDWGLAKSLSEEQGEAPLVSSPATFDSINPLKTVAGAIFGTPHFMPPEQARGDTVDERADVYSIGSILYHLLSGKAPYHDSRITSQSGSLLQQLREEAPTSLLLLVPEAPRDLLSIVEKAMARKKEDRYRNASELASDLADFTAGQRVAVHHYSTRELLSRWLRRHKAAVATAAVLFTALLVTALVSFLSVVDNRDQAEAAAKLAQSETRRADETTEEAMEFLAERGRIDLLEDRPVHALILLSKAFKHLSDRPANQVLMAAAMRSIDALQLSFESHKAGMDSIAISHDSTRLASMDLEGELRIWDVESGALLQVMQPGPNASRSRPVFSSDDSALAVGGSKGATIWNPHSGQMLLTIAGDFAYLGYDHRDRLITIDIQGHVLAWDTRTSEKTLLHQIKDHPQNWRALMTYDRKTLLISLNRVQQIDLVSDVARAKTLGDSPRLVVIDSCRDNNYLLTSDAWGAMRLWDLREAVAVHSLQVPNEALADLTLALSPNCKNVAVTAAGRPVDIYNLESGEIVSSFDASDSGVTRLLFSPSGAQIATIGRDEVVRLWEVATGRWRTAFVGHSRLGYNAAFLASGESLIVGDTTGKLRKWDASADVIAYDLKRESSAAVMDPSGARAIVKGESSVLLLDATTLATVAEIATSDHLYATRFSADGSRVVIGDSVYSAVDGKLIRRFDARMDLRMMVALSGTGRVVAISNQEHLKIWEVDSGTLLYQADNGGRMPLPVWLSADGTYALTLLTDFAIGHLDLTTGVVSKHFGKLSLNRYLFSFLKAPDKVLVNISKEELAVVEVATGKHLRTLKGNFRSITVGRDGVQVLAVSGTRAFLWNTETGAKEQLLDLRQPRYYFASALSHDGNIIALASLDAVYLYDRQRGTLLLKTSLGSDVLTGLVFAASNDTLLVTASDRLLVVDIHRETRTPAVIEDLVRERVGRGLTKGHFLPTQLPDTQKNNSAPTLTPGRLSSEP